MANNYPNVMDGSRLTDQNIYTCRICCKQFLYYSDFAVHERMHFELPVPGSLQSSLRPPYENHAVPSYSAATSAASGALDSFDKLIQPFRSSIPETADIRSQTDARNLIPTSQPDLRNYVPSSAADPRNVSSPGDVRNMVATSPADPRNIVPSPADPRNLMVSSPADSRNMVPSSPADPRGLVPSPVDPRNMVPASPVDPRNMVPASPVDPRNMVPASPADPRNMVPASPVDPRNMVPASPADPRNMVPASPVDPRNLVAASPAAHQDPRTLIVSSPASQTDISTSQLYRGELDGQQNINLGSRSTPIHTQTAGVSMATVPMTTDARLLPVDTRQVQSQVTDTRHLVPDSHGLTYSSPSFLDSLTRSLYTQDLTNKPMSAPPFGSHSIGRPEDILGLDSRQVPIQKPDPYYGIPKSMYHPPAGSDIGDGYATNQYGIGKILGPQQGAYYQQPVSSQLQPSYGIDKLTASSLNYYNQPNSTDKSSIEQRDILPKQTLHYGPSVPSPQPVSTPNHSHYQQSIPQSDHQHTSTLSQQKVSNSAEQLQAYHSGSSSPHLTHSQVYKGSQPQTQVYAPVPSHALPSQHDYKLSTEPLPTINLEPKQQQKQKITCYICHAPFSNMDEMSEHLKIHAQGMVSQNPVPPQTSLPQQYQMQTVFGTLPTKPIPEISRPRVGEKVANNQGFAPVNPLNSKDVHPVKTKYNVPVKSPNPKESMPVNCHICGKSFTKPAFLNDHMKLHLSPQQYECKTCGKVFKKKSKCTRHEALHSRNIHLYYCEICDDNFEQKGKYLHHIQNRHTEQDSIRIHQHRHQTGTKKAVPLTGGSIDTTFDGMDVEKYIDCQICDEEIEKVKLVPHLKMHDVHSCDKCDQVFLQKTECVEHLMSQHRKELADVRSEDEHESLGKKSPLKADSRMLKGEQFEKKGDVKSETSGSAPKVNRSRKDVIKDLKKEKEGMKSLKEKQKALRDVDKDKKIKDVTADSLKNKISNSINTSLSEVKLKFSCSKCEKSFAKNADLIAHAATHVRDPTRIYCEVCDFSYQAKEKGYYIYHMKYHRDHELLDSKYPAQMRCIICNDNIPKEKFITHIKRAHSLYSCDICQWSYSTVKTLTKHMRSIHGGKKYKFYVYDESHYIENIVEPEPTTEPPVVYKKLKDIKAEQQIQEKKRPTKVFTCPECNREFFKKQYYEKHMKSHNITTEEPHLDCELCQASLDSRGTYIYHLQQHSSIENATSIDNSNEKVEASEKDLKVNENLLEDSINESESMVENAEMVKMDVDKINSETENSLQAPTKQTLITVLNPETGDFEEKMIEEKDEPEITIDIKIFEEDFDKNEDVVDNSKSKIDVVSEIVYCRLCNKCVKRNTLSEHMRTHLTYSCHSCMFAFRKKQRFIDHQRTLHLTEYIAEEIKKFEQAEQSFREELVKNDQEQKGKDSHRRKRSTKMMNCPLCTSELKQSKYIEHLKSHDRVVLNCQFCKLTFTKKNLLTMHEKSHIFVGHGANELPYLKSCPICDVSINSREQYVHHITEHSNKVPFKCKVCETDFTTEKILEMHMKNNHNPHVKTYWTHDFEGVKFDTKTGRVHDALSDYMSELKELNYLCKLNGKSEIWTTQAAKNKERSINVSKVKETTGKETEVSESNETSEGDDKVQKETSDEDYVPERNLRKRSGKEESEEDSEMDKPSRKKSRNSRNATDSTSEDDYKPKSTRSRKMGVKKDLLKQKIKKLKQAAGRVLRSTIESKNEKKLEKVKKEHVKRKSDSEEKGGSPKKKRSELENLSFEEVHKERSNTDFPEKCPDCGIAQFSLESYNQHARLHTGNMPFRCPVCKQTFTRKYNMKVHVRRKHSEYKKKNSNKRERKIEEKSDSADSGRILRKHDKSPESKPGTPISASTPIKGSRLVVKLSPIDVESKKKSIKESSSKANVSKRSLDLNFLKNVEKKSVYQCDVCSKKFTQRWNYVQHIQGHSRVGKKKENKTVLNKRDLKKKEKESKPFSCKDCSESFKKKRDLYIHTKIHSTDDDEVADKTENIDDSINTETDTSIADKTNESLISVEQSHAEKNGRLSESKSENNNSSVNESLEMSTDCSDKNKNESPRNEIGNGLKENDKAQKSSKTSESSVLGIDGKTKNKSVKSGLEVNNVNAKNGCEVVKDVPQNNNDEHSRSGENSDSEKTKPVRQPSINKMSAETAVSKWKAKVTELLSSQMDRFDAKQQEAQANPEIKRLSISGKVEKFKFECRICGNSTCDQESTFRTHMDIHLNEPPPHCSICDIYFMAIHPMRRLAEHNKKKHPELNC